MNENEVLADENQWAVDGSDVEFDSEGSLSGSDDTEGEVPETTGVGNDVNPSSNPIVGKPVLRTPVWTAHPPTVGTPNNKEGSFSRGWKPVIDGKIQVVSEVATPKVRTTPLQATSTTPSGTQHASTEIGSPSLAVTGAVEPKKDGNESDSEVRRVPDMSSKEVVSGSTAAQPQGQSSAPRSRKRGGAPADKEHKRLKRLLRNRVSAQQARERKKAYLSDLEVRSKELQQRNEELEERVSTLERENYMLRQIVKTTSLKKFDLGDCLMPL